MKLITLDYIVRSYLLERGRSLHYYVEALQHAIDCVRELNFDSIRNIKPVMLTINSYNSVDLPCDYIDYAKVGVPVGQYIYPLVERNSMNRLVNYNTNGQPIPYPTLEEQYGSGSWGFPLWNDGYGYYYWYNNNINSHGEFYEGMFNHVPSYHDSFIVLTERNQIQVDNCFSQNTLYLEYITDGLDCCSGSTMITEYAYSCIKDYIYWKTLAFKKNTPAVKVMDAENNFYNSLRILRGRVQPLTIEIVKMALRRNYTPTMKS